MGKVGRPGSDLRERLLDAAWRIFTRHGYQAATVSAVIDSVGVSKGSYYHYFSSKEDLFDAVVERLALEVMESIERVALDPQLTAVTRYNRIMDLARTHRLDNIGLVTEAALMVNRPENAVFRARLQARTRELMGPLLARIIRQGVTEGIFDPPSPDRTADLLLDISSLAGGKSMAILEQGGPEGDCARAVGDNINFHLEIMERILGAPEGCLNRIDHALAGEMVTAFRNRPAAEEREK